MDDETNEKLKLCCDTWAVVKFYCLKGKTPTKMFQKMKSLSKLNIQGLTIKFQDCASKTGKKVSKKNNNFFLFKIHPIRVDTM